MIAPYISKYCKDYKNIENYEQAVKDQTQTWECHHRLETDLGLSMNELINKNLYFDRPANELIFLTCAEHIALHNSITNKHYGNKNSMYGRNHKEESKQKISKTKKEKFKSGETIAWHKGKKCEQFAGENNPFYNKHHTEESKEKNRQSHLGKHRVYREDGTWYMSN